ncbi:Coiled-coil domain-containing protein 96 [Platysternon megacephalum]|uniref:Coiled-coil domain-containing protein 96 n=1 Tax=Platysternon megacephalum TaxID=55544 RepID=A0A4D9ERW0_9SAUR|nr:Coiled-coil domain-containing protein 96 [Platysternon megacephalum]
MEEEQEGAEAPVHPGESPVEAEGPGPVVEEQAAGEERPEEAGGDSPLEKPAGDEAAAEEGAAEPEHRAGTEPPSPAAEGTPEAEAGAAPEAPTSASFTEGEAEEPPPLQVGEVLSPQESWGEGRPSLPLLELGSPIEEEEEGGEEAAAAEQRQRAELTEQYRLLLAERERTRQYNGHLQFKLYELFRKKGEEPPRVALEELVSDKGQRYARYLAMLEELRSQLAQQRAWYQLQIDDLEQRCTEKLDQVNADWLAFQACKKEVTLFTMGRQLGGKEAAIKEVEHIQAKEQRKENEMSEVRLENIKLQHKIEKLEVSLKAQEELAEGLHLIDFEQLKIENQTYNEKIEERNEELLKLRKKITNTVQVLTQLKEKLQFVEAQNQDQRAQLMETEALVAQKREILTKTKQARDSLRVHNLKLRQKCGLLGSEALLRDFENKVDAAEVLSQRLEMLKRHHAGLTLTCKSVKKKIKEAKSFLPE